MKVFRPSFTEPDTLRRAFTLIELLAVIGILITLATLTAMSVQRIGRDTRLSKATNTLLGVLERARSQAIREHKPMLVTFVVRVERRGPLDTDPIRTEWVEAVTARLEDARVHQKNPETPSSWDQQYYMDRFEPHPSIPPTAFAPGIKVAGPAMDDFTGMSDRTWVTQPDLANTEFGKMIGVMFGPDGALLTRLSGGGAANAAKYRSIVLDLDRDGEQRAPDPGEGTAGYFDYDDLEDETRIYMMQLVAVFDDKIAREVFDAAYWSGSSYQPRKLDDECSDLRKGTARKLCEQSEFISQFADRIFINRNTGRAELQQR